MKIAIVNEGDWRGNAYKVVLLLHEHLREQGADARLLVRVKRREDSAAELVPFSRSLFARLRRRRRRLMIRASELRGGRRRGLFDETFEPGWSQYGAEMADVLSGYDMVNLQFASTLIDYGSSLPELCDRVSVVWTLHDMNTFTGGCHYAACRADGYCERFMEGCGCCPELGCAGLHDLSHRAWAMKRKAFGMVNASRLCFVTPSSWLAGICREAPLLHGFRTSVAPNAVNLDAFQPRPRDVARSVLGLPASGKAILFVAQSRENRRKGFGLLAEALQRLDRHASAFVVSVGAGGPHLDLPLKYYDLGRILSDGVLSLAYSAADVFVVPSILDNLPCTAVESIACGTPVVAFDVGGMRDIVVDRETGRLVPAGDTAALAQVIEEVLDGGSTEMMQRNCRELAATKFAPDAVARRYLDVFASAV